MQSHSVSPSHAALADVPVPIAGAEPPEPEDRRADLPGSVVIKMDNKADSRFFNICERGIGKWKSYGVIF